MNGHPNSILELQQAMADFVAERDWQAFHTPKDLALALNVEAGELLENFLWRSSDDEYLKDDEWRKGLEEEMADVLLYLLALANATGSDLVQAANDKLELNRRRFPVGAQPL